MLKQRILTGALLGLLMTGGIAVSGCAPLMRAMGALLALPAALELCRAGGYLRNRPFTFCCAASAVLLALCGDGALAGPVLLAALAGGLYLMTHMGQPEKLPEWLILPICAVCGYFFGLTASLRQREQGLYLLILAVAVPVLTDVGAYCFGKAFGKHRLAPRVSPHKTWEGSLGGTACAVVLLTAAALTAGRFGLLRVRLRPLLLYLTGCSVLSQLGDLTFSALKRIAGIKDYGKLLPGHGGILDRFDSLLFAVPFTLFFDCCLCPLFGAN